MSDFFYRQSKVKLPSGGRIRNNAYVTVSGNGFSLPIGLTDFSSTYNPNGTGRPAATLGEVKIKLEGTAGSLRRCEVGFMCYDKASFEAAEAALLLPGSEVTVSYGYSGPQSPGGAGSYVFRVYDYSFSITKENYFDCKFKGVGKGGEYLNAELQSKNAFPNVSFVTNFFGSNKKTKVQNIFDYVDYSVQKATGTLAAVSFDVDNGTAGELPEGGHFAVLLAPDGYEGSAMNPGLFRTERIPYVSLEAIVGMINRYCLSQMKPDPLTIEINPEFATVQTKFKSGLIFSANPFRFLIPYEEGTPENGYPDDPGWFGITDDYLTADVIDGGPVFSNTKESNPGKILICREFLREIQESVSVDIISTSGKSNQEVTEPGLAIGKFFDKIFGAIRDCTGGAWDFYLDQDEFGTEAGIVQIVNRKAASEGEVSPVVIDPISGTNGIRDLKIEASVPKELQAKMFGSAPATSNDTQASKDALSGEETADENTGKVDIAEQCKNARFKIHESEYATEGFDSAKAAVKALVTEFDSLADRVAKGQVKDHNDPVQMPMPLTFSCTMDGIEGWQFGDTVTSNYLPSRYNQNGRGKIVFTVTDYEHTIKENDWSTTINAAGRLR